MTVTASFPGNRNQLREGVPLLRHLLRKNLPWMGAFFALSFWVLPVHYILEIFMGRSSILFLPGDDAPVPFGAPNATPARIFTELSMEEFLVLVTGTAILLALVQTRWLRSKGEAEFWHSLPVGREVLLLSQAAAAWLTIALPLLADYLVVLLAGGLRLAAKRPGQDFFILPVGEILLDLLGWLSVTLAIIAIIFLAGVMTGRLAETLAVSGILFCGPPGVCAFLELSISHFLVGWNESSVFLDLLEYSSPLVLMLGRYESYNSFSGTYPAQSSWMLLLWLALGLFCLWLACRGFRDRPAESAGNGGVREPLGLAVSLLAAFAGGLAIGLWFWDTLPFPLLVALASFGVAVVSRLLLGCGLRGLVRGLPLVALCMVLPVAAALVVTSGGLGYESHLPPVDRVGQVQVQYRGRYGTLAKRLDHKEGLQDLGTDGRTWYQYPDQQYVVLTTPEGIQAAEDLHSSLARWQQQAPKGHKSLAGSIQFLYDDGTSRIYGQRQPDHLAIGQPRELEALLDLEENPEFRRQTDPRFTITPNEVRAVWVSDVTGLITSEAITNEGTLARLLAAMKADAEAFRTSTLRDGTARAVAYLSVETTAPTPVYKVTGPYWEGETTTPIEQDLWRDFCLPVYLDDRNTQAVLTDAGYGAYTDPAPGLEKVTGLLVDWWGDCSWIREAYWTGTGPRDLWPGQNAAIEHSEVPEARLSVTAPAQRKELLDRSLGVDCHISERGFLVTLVGEDRQGSTFWLSTWEEAPGFVQSWYRENEKQLISGEGMRYQHLP